MGLLLDMKRLRSLKTKSRLSKILQAETTNQGLRHRDLADMTGIAQSTVSRCLSGDMPISKEHAEMIATALMLDKEWIVGMAFGEKELSDLLEKYADYPKIYGFLSSIKTKMGVA